MKRFLPLCAVVALFAVGCSTPDARIKRNPELFQSLPPEIQENVRQGRIDIGYPQAAVRIALGAPNREYTRRTAETTVSVWAYTAERVSYERQRADARVRVYDAQGRRRTVTDWVWVDVERRHEYDRMRVEFTGDTVTAIEMTER
ncbi:MAG TPA: hypothetical protein PKE12_06260 [Kiritimatiellia bacterium]|nr:hypothetical protein [Kiritimatiellia bacterium]